MFISNQTRTQENKTIQQKIITRKDDKTSSLEPEDIRGETIANPSDFDNNRTKLEEYAKKSNLKIYAENVRAAFGLTVDPLGSWMEYKSSKSSEDGHKYYRDNNVKTIAEKIWGKSTGGNDNSLVGNAGIFVGLVAGLAVDSLFGIIPVATATADLIMNRSKKDSLL